MLCSAPRPAAGISGAMDAAQDGSSVEAPASSVVRYITTSLIKAAYLRPLVSELFPGHRGHRVGRVALSPESAQRLHPFVYGDHPIPDLRALASRAERRPRRGLPRSPYLISVFSRGAHRASRTGEPDRALETVSASWALGPFFALKRRKVPGQLHRGDVLPPAHLPRELLQAGGRQFPR